MHPTESPTSFIATSLSPGAGAEERQREALGSWQKAGFGAVSLNFPDETGRIRSAYPGICEPEEAGPGCSGGHGRKLAAVADLIEISYR